MPGWHDLPEATQLTLAREAIRRAVDTVANQAEQLAEEMEAGALDDRGGPDALRLFAALVREVNAGGGGGGVRGHA